MDFQISCLSDSYLAFVSLGMIGVCVYPLGIPTLTLLQLWRNSKDIKRGGPALERYEFLVADYTPEFYYWDCLEVRDRCSLPVQLPLNSLNIPTNSLVRVGVRFP